MDIFTALQHVPEVIGVVDEPATDEAKALGAVILRWRSAPEIGVLTYAEPRRTDFTFTFEGERFGLVCFCRRCAPRNAEDVLAKAEETAVRSGITKLFVAFPDRVRSPGAVNLLEPDGASWPRPGLGLSLGEHIALDEEAVVRLYFEEGGQPVRSAELEWDKTHSRVTAVAVSA